MAIMWSAIATIALLFISTICVMAYRLGYRDGRVDGKLERLEQTAVQLLDSVVQQKREGE